MLRQAAKALAAEGKGATVVADSGVENVNREVDELPVAGVLRRVLAQVEVAFSNSIIEALWRCLKHGWLFLNTLDTLAAVERLVAFHVDQHNSVMPNAAFDGQTPDEVFFGSGDDVPNQLAAGHRRARLARLAANRGMTCAACVGESSPSDVTRVGPNQPVISEVLQLHTAESQMS